MTSALLASLLLLAAEERVLVLAGEDDRWSITAATQLEANPPANVRIVRALEVLTAPREGVSFVPVFADDEPEHDPQAMRDTVQQRLFQARAIAEVARAKTIVSEALTYARQIPASDPDRRAASVRQALRELATVLLKEDPKSEAAHAVVEELILRESGIPSGSESKALAQVYRTLSAKAKRMPRARVRLTCDPLRLAIDGQASAPFERNPVLTLPVGTHELVALSGDTPLWVRHIAVGMQDLTVPIATAMEKAVALTPQGLRLRRGTALSASMAQALARQAGVDYVWLLEKSDAAEATVRVIRARDGDISVAKMRWNGPVNDVPLALVGTAGGVATTRTAPLAMRSYEVREHSPSEFLFVPYQGDWQAPAPWYKKWWVWTIAGGVVGASVIAAVVVATRDDGKRAVTPTLVFP